MISSSVTAKAAFCPRNGSMSASGSQRSDWPILASVVKYCIRDTFFILNHVLVLGRRRSGLGCPGARHIRANDLPTLSQLDSGIAYRPKNQRRCIVGYRVGGRSKNDSERFFETKPDKIKALRWGRRGELNHPQDSDLLTEKVLDSPAKSRTFAAFEQTDAGPKRAQKDPNNPEKPDQVRSVGKKPRNQ